MYLALISDWTFWHPRSSLSCRAIYLDEMLPTLGADHWVIIRQCHQQLVNLVLHGDRHLSLHFELLRFNRRHTRCSRMSTDAVCVQRSTPSPRRDRTGAPCVSPPRCMRSPLFLHAIGEELANLVSGERRRSLLRGGAAMTHGWFFQDQEDAFRF